MTIIGRPLGTTSVRIGFWKHAPKTNEFGFPLLAKRMGNHIE